MLYLYTNGRHFKKHKIISEMQFGFKKGVLTVDAMHTLISFIQSALNSNRRPLAIFLDLAKAFDTVPYDKLLERLEGYGVRGLAKELMTDYLADRRQTVMMNNKQS